WIIRKVLSKEPSARYRTADQLAHVLDEYRKHVELETGEYSAIPQTDSVLRTPEEAAAVLETPKVIPLQSSQDAADRVAPWSPPKSGSAGRPFEDTLSPAAASRLSNLTWFLSAIAFVAIVGLVVLWSLVYRSYTEPTPPSGTSTPDLSSTLTVQAALVPVPGLVGKSVDDAQRMLGSLDLQYSISTKEDPTSTDGTVIEQVPAPNQLVARESQVTLVVSGPGRELMMPGMVGYSIDAVRSGLESDDLRVYIETTWSTEPDGVILKQIPEAGSSVHAGDALTLTVSGGVDTPILLDARLGDFVVLESAELRHLKVQPGDIITLNLRWQSLQSVDTQYVVFVHLLSPTGQLGAQQDTEPVVPTTDWLPGIDFVDSHQIEIPNDLPAGQYQIRVGMYPQGQPGSRVEVVDQGMTVSESNSLLVAIIEIDPGG
ncbi:MAG: PASTA domain-containing protein, partial [Anaerolineae bacterium]|nr:PASTA domain-containing protein [Anaerolineae bacterium]